MWLFFNLVLGGAPSPPRTIAPPPPPESLNQTLVVLLILIGVVLLVLLVVLVCYVCKLHKDFSQEEVANEELKEKLEPLQQTKDEKEKQMLEELARRMHTLKKRYEDSRVLHAKFVKDHDPAVFEKMKETGEIRIAGDEEIAEVVVQRDIDKELRATDVDDIMPAKFDDGEKQRILMETERTNKVTELRKQMKELRKKQEERRKVRTLEDEKIGLQQQLNDLELEEKLDSLKRLEKKQKEREAIDNMKTSKRLAITSDGEYIISRMGGNSLSGDGFEQYDSDYDYDDDVPELPEHLDNMNPRGKMLKAKLDSQRASLRDDKEENKRRECEMERDMTLMRLRIDQQKRRNERVERRAKQKASESEKAPTEDSEGTKSFHKPVPHFITAPWNVENIAQHSKGGARRRPVSGKHEQAEKNLLNFVAEAMTDPAAQASALESRNYLLTDDTEGDEIHPDTLKKGAVL